jgi:hypothetical protein
MEIFRRDHGDVLSRTQLFLIDEVRMVVVE